MRVLQINYALWDQVVKDNALRPCHKFDGDECVVTWAGIKDVIFRCAVNPDNYPIWTVAHGITSIQVNDQDEALARIAGSREVPTAPYARSGERTHFVGQICAVPGSGSYGFEKRLDKSVRLQGGHYWVQGAVVGDTLDLDVVDKDNVLGLGANYVVANYVDAAPLAPWDALSELIAPSAAALKAGLYLRLTIHHTSSEPMALGVTYRWFVAV